MPPTIHPSTMRSSSVQMMFGGGGGDDKGDAGFMEKLGQMKDMFNPEMMKKYSQVGERIQALQGELAQTEVECATKDGGVTVTVSGTQVPMKVTVSGELCSTGVDAVSSELTMALKQAHAKSGKYAQDRMKNVYEELGLAPGMAPGQQ